MKNISFASYICFVPIFLFLASMYFINLVFLDKGEGKRGKLDRFSGVSHTALAAGYIRADCCSKNLNC